jgi:hypothetical protein
MIVIALRTDLNQQYNSTKNKRSLFVNSTPPRTLCRSPSADASARHCLLQVGSWT